MLQRPNLYTVTPKIHSAGSSSYNNHTSQRPYQKTLAVILSNLKEQAYPYTKSIIRFIIAKRL